MSVLTYHSALLLLSALFPRSKALGRYFRAESHHVPAFGASEGHSCCLWCFPSHKGHHAEHPGAEQGPWVCQVVPSDPPFHLVC